MKLKSFLLAISLFFLLTAPCFSAYDTIQLRRGTAATWASVNPIPAQGEPCFETDTGKLKIGDGTSHYNSLSYLPNLSSGVDYPYPYEIDALAVYGGGTSYTQATIEAALNAIGTANKVTLLFRPGAWAISTPLAFPSNATPLLPAGAYFSYSGTGAVTFGDGSIPYVRASWFGLITFGTSASSAQQTVNHLALQRAATAAMASGLPMSIPTGTILLNDEVVCPTSLKIESEGFTRILQTAAAKNIFVLGTTGTYTSRWALKNFQLATATGSYDCVQLLAVTNGDFENVSISGSGRYGWNIGGTSASQELHFRNCPVNGYLPEIDGQAVSGSNGDFVRAFNITNATTIQLDGVDISIGQAGIYSTTSDLKLTWYGTAQGQTGYALEVPSGGINGFDLNLHLEGDASDIRLAAATNGKIHLRNTSKTGIYLTSSANVRLSGQINTVSISADSRAIKGENITYGAWGGYIKDQSPDGEWVNCTLSAENHYYGLKNHNPLTSVFPNTGLERWTSTTAPCGLAVWGASTVTKTGTGLADTEKFNGSFAAKVLGGGASSGLAFTFPVAEVAGKWVTVRTRYKIATATDSGGLQIYLNAGAAVYSQAFTSTDHTAWYRHESTFYIPTDATGARVILKADNTKTVYFDDVDILVNGLSPALPQTLTVDSATPDISLGSLYIPFWKSASTAPKTITNFVNGYGGLEYTVWIGEANTTLGDGATLQLRGSANKTGSGTFVKLILDSESGVWYQTAYESAN